MILYLTPKSKRCLVLEGILFTKHNVARVKWLLGILDISRSEAFSKNRSHLYDSEISSYIFETAKKNLSFKFVCFFQYSKR